MEITLSRKLRVSWVRYEKEANGQWLMLRSGASSLNREATDLDWYKDNNDAEVEDAGRVYKTAYTIVPVDIYTLTVVGEEIKL